ncbi:ankyrin [Apiospora sp. TS-2023a]
MATGIEIVGGLAACIEVVKFSKSIVAFVANLRQDSSEIDHTLQYFENTIKGIKTVFEHIQDAINHQRLSKSDSVVAFVCDYGQFCATLLGSLEKELPEIPANPSHRQKVWATLKQKIKEKTIQKQVEVLQRYMHITQLALWAIESRRMSRQDTKIDEMHELLSELTALPAYSPSDPDDRDYHRLRTDIDKIREVATRKPTVPNIDMESISGLDNLPSSIRALLIRDRPLSMPDRPNTPSPNDPVATLEGRGMFLRAANEVSQRALSHDEEMEQDERRADLLLKCATIWPHQRALKILIRLWESESKRDTQSMSPKRLGQLGWKLARLSLDSKRLGHFTEQERADDHRRAITVLDESMTLLLDKIQTLRPYPYQTILSVAELLIHILKETGNTTYADQTGTALRQKLGDLGGDPFPIPLDWPHRFEASRSDALAWCEPANLARLHEKWPEKATVIERPDLRNLEFDVRSVDFRFEVTVNGISPIHLAVIYEEKEILPEMLGDVEDINAVDPGFSTPLMEAAINGNEDIANMLLAHEASVECVGPQQRTALHWAQIGNGHNSVSVSQLFLAAPQGGSILDKQDVDGKTALHLACKKGNENMVKLLVTTHKARVNVADVYWKTALHATVEAKDRLEERLRIAQILLKAKADPNTSDYGDRTPLFIACSQGNYELVCLLLEYGADPDQRGPEEQTPLIVATKRRHVNIVRVLMGKGAQPNKKDASRQSALSYAERMKTTSQIYNILCGSAPSSRRQMSIASTQSAPVRRTDTASTQSTAHRSLDLESKGSSPSSRRSPRQ